MKSAYIQVSDKCIKHGNIIPIYILSICIQDVKNHVDLLDVHYSLEFLQVFLTVGMGSDYSLTSTINMI